MAINWDLLKAHYLQADQSTQISHLVLNLARIQLLASSNSQEMVAKHLVRESQFLIEWTVPTLNLDRDLPFATELVELQRLLSAWKLHWSELWNNASDRDQIAAQAEHWSQQLQLRRTAIAH